MRPSADIATLSSDNSRLIARLAAATGTSVASVAFFVTLKDCMIGSTLPHPVCARNANITAIWRGVESKVAAPAVSVMSDPRQSFQQNIGLVRNFVEHEPIYQRGFQAGDETGLDDTALGLVVAPLMFWGRRNAIIELTDALERILVDSDLGEDLPVGLFRPPLPACYIHFGKTFRDTAVPAPNQPTPGAYVIQGVYVLEAQREGQRAVTIMPVFTLRDQASFGANLMEMIVSEHSSPDGSDASLIDETRPLNQAIRTTCESYDFGQGAHFESIAQIVAKVFLYMGLPQTVRIEERDYSVMHDRLKRIGPKKAAKLQRQLPDLYDRIVLGPQEIHVHGHGEVSPHLRRGHFRMQPHGPQNSLRRLIFISPTWVHADRLAGP